ncbi:MAG: hypothetical protein HN919_09780 [Verrucomicrobia bacterium]|mgnify:CR=1 FL=1|jgi:hypothetical protein|nr:hypothetical protein [Verrucomicrobiota bacterium]MBT7066580.1 hypothetical protein [Verrucomicrobiota bacterium]MBT7701510.1 hypothetical protein [Verrucomicrobiota bacterium]
MPTCLHCSAENTLGRVFCFRCGKKLELAEPTAADLRVKKRTNVVSSLSGFVLLVAAVLVIGAGIRFWPEGDPLGLAPSKTGAKRVSLALRGMHLSEGTESVGSAFRESDINAYLNQLRVEALGVSGFSVELTPDRIRLRMHQDDKPWKILWMTFYPTFTRDLVLKPVEGGTVEVVSAKIGHLPLPAAFSESTAQRFRDLFEGEREMLVLKRVQEIELKDRAIALVVGQ